VTRNAIEIARLLVVSSDSAVLRPLWSMRESNCWQLEVAANAWEAMDEVQSGATLDLLLLDLPQGGAEALHILHRVRRLRPALPIILIGHPGDVDRKQESIRMGARDYLTRPLDDHQLEMVIQRNLSMVCEATETDITSEDVEPVSNGTFFIGISPIMRKLRAQAALLAEVDVPVLILGENGSGKETAARLVHRLSVRSGFEFAKVDCAALPGDLLERELFGYERISATVPTRSKPGKLELCAKGTILLDEITEMPLSLQSKLLHVLQNKRFIRPGTPAFIEVDVRILATSPANIERAISENRLRRDLYQHLGAYTINVPPLRERKEELPFLSRHFMHRLAKHYGLSPRDFSAAIIDAWQAYNWPGNLRELEHLVKRYLMVGDKELAFEKSRSDSEGDAEDAALARPRTVKQQAPSPSHSRPGGFKSLRSLVQSVKSEAERNAIAVALEKTGWNRKAAARLLNVSYRTVLYKIEQYDITSSNSLLFPRGDGLGSKETGFRGNGPTECAQIGK
jgi:two-component system, NtrC family, response regulator AtoC